MIFFFLPISGLLAAVIGGIVFGAAYAFIRRSPSRDNPFGPPSPTQTIGSALGRAVMRMFDFTGRANRMDFWAFAVLMAVPAGLALPGMVITGIIVSNTAVDIRLPLAVGIVLAFLVAAGLAAVACLSMAVRRLHDINRSGWWVLLLGTFGYFILLYWFLQPSVRAADEEAQVFT
jgi:uncharacterized membrane protein YhaH (DUF805 family)